jgi:hypothetical protein
MNEKHTFRSKEEEVSNLLEELAALRELMRDIAKKLTNIEARTKRAFPSAATKRVARRGEANADPNPTLLTQDVWRFTTKSWNWLSRVRKKKRRTGWLSRVFPILSFFQKNLACPLATVSRQGSG